MQTPGSALAGTKRPSSAITFGAPSATSGSTHVLSPFGTSPAVGSGTPGGSATAGTPSPSKVVVTKATPGSNFRCGNLLLRCAL
jgi:hypothetical protein